jgi:hypothetical protein
MRESTKIIHAIDLIGRNTHASSVPAMAESVPGLQVEQPPSTQHHPRTPRLIRISTSGTRVVCDCLGQGEGARPWRTNPAKRTQRHVCLHSNRLRLGHGTSEASDRIWKGAHTANRANELSCPLGAPHPMKMESRSAILDLVRLGIEAVVVSGVSSPQTNLVPTSARLPVEPHPVAPRPRGSTTRNLLHASRSSHRPGLAPSIGGTGQGSPS